MKIIRRFAYFCTDHIGLLCCGFLSGLAISRAIHDEYSNVLLYIPFIVLWWAYDRTNDRSVVVDEHEFAKGYGEITH